MLEICLILPSLFNKWRAAVTFSNAYSNECLIDSTKKIKLSVVEPRAWTNLDTLFMLQKNSSKDFGRPMFVGNMWVGGNMSEFVERNGFLSGAPSKLHGLLRGLSDTNMSLLCTSKFGDQLDTLPNFRTQFPLLATLVQLVLQGTTRMNHQFLTFGLVQFR